MSSSFGSGPTDPPFPSAGFAPPLLAEAVAPAPARHAEYAGFWKRFLAYVLDFFLLVPVGFVVNGVMRMAAGISVTPIWSASSEATAIYKLVENLVGVVVGWVYFAVLESSSRQATLGKMALGLVVTDLTGQRIGFGRATGRYWAKLLSAITLLIGFLMAGFTRRKQALHDMVASTLVLKV